MEDGIPACIQIMLKSIIARGGYYLWRELVLMVDDLLVEEVCLYCHIAPGFD